MELDLERCLSGSAALRAVCFESTGHSTGLVGVLNIAVVWSPAPSTMLAGFTCESTTSCKPPTMLACVPCDSCESTASCEPSTMLACVTCESTAVWEPTTIAACVACESTAACEPSTDVVCVACVGCEFAAACEPACVACESAACLSTAACPRTKTSVMVAASLVDGVSRGQEPHGPHLPQAPHPLPPICSVTCRFAVIAQPPRGAVKGSVVVVAIVSVEHFPSGFSRRAHVQGSVCDCNWGCRLAAMQRLFVFRHLV